MLGFAALLVDLGQLRATSRIEQLDVDLAALAGGKELSGGDRDRSVQRRDHLPEYQHAHLAGGQPSHVLLGDQQQLLERDGASDGRRPPSAM